MVRTALCERFKFIEVQYVHVMTASHIRSYKLIPLAMLLKA
jgi:hypothetical protein